MLVTVTLYLSLAQNQEDMRLIMIDKTKQIVSETIEEIRQLSKRLVGPVLKHLTLKESLRKRLFPLPSLLMRMS